MSVTPPVALTIAGVDSGGAAGVAADLTTFAALGVHGAVAVTALTAQDTTAVHEVRVTPADFVRRQVEVVLGDLPVASVKTGLLGDAAVVDLVADLAEEGRLPHLVVDPVMVASTGRSLLDAEAEQLYRARLVPAATVVTPNLREAGVLVGAELTDLADVLRSRDALAALCPRGHVVVTGGHLAGAPVDVVISVAGVVELDGPIIDTRNDHGSGCTFAAALAAGLAHGLAVPAAATRAKAFVAGRLEASAGWRLGAGRGPVAHTAL